MIGIIEFRTLVSLPSGETSVLIQAIIVKKQFKFNEGVNYLPTNHLDIQYYFDKGYY